jgi:tetratricopeptide (TPR) repeat protein
MHALFMCLSALSTLLFFQAMAQPRCWSRWLAYALATTASIYTMYFGFLILAAQANYLLFSILDFRHLHSAQAQLFWISKSGILNQKSEIANLKSKIVGFAAATTLACLLYLPWWPVLFDLLRKRAAVGAIEGGVGRPLDFVRGVVQALGPLPEPVAWIFLLLFMLGIISMARRRWPIAAFAGLWLALPVALPILLGDPRALQFRYAFVLPLYLTVIAYTVWLLAARASQTLFKLKTIHPSSLILHPSIFLYLIWLLATLSLIATLGIYNQPKPDWRSAAAYLDEKTNPADIILIGPLWDEGRFIDYYYRGQAQLLTPAAMVTNIQDRVDWLRQGGGRVWAVNRFPPAESPVTRNVIFPGAVVVSEPTLAVYEPVLLAEAALDLAAQAVEAAYPWAAQVEAEGVLDPDPRTAQAAALRAWGDALVAAGRPPEALEPYQQAVDIFPGWVSGFIALAEAQELTGNLPAAAEAYRQAVHFNNDWQGPPADDASALVEAGKWAEAIDKYHQLIER